MTAAAAEATPVARKSKKEDLGQATRLLEQEIRVNKARKTKPAKAGVEETFLQMASGLDLADLADQLGVSEKSVKKVMKSLPKGGEKFLKDYERKRVAALLETFEENGVELRLRRGKNKTVDKVLDALEEEEGKGSWSWGKIAAVAGGVLVTGVVAYEGYQYFTGGNGLFGNYGGGVPADPFAAPGLPAPASRVM